MNATENAYQPRDSLVREIASLLEINAELVAEVSDRDKEIGCLRGVVEQFREILVGEDKAGDPGALARAAAEYREQHTATTAEEQTDG